MRILILMMVICFYSCKDSGVERTMRIAGGNRAELERVLMHYSINPEDSIKLKAAEFLIENMQYHKSVGRLIDDDSISLIKIIEADSIYYPLVNKINLDEFYSKDFKSTLSKISTARKDILAQKQESRFNIDNQPYFDCSTLSSEFLISHIDNAFKVWGESPYAKDLSFDEFKEYILPYRAISYRGFHISGATYNELFQKYFVRDTSLQIDELTQYYNQTIKNIRSFNGKSKQLRHSGVYDFFSTDAHDCSDMSNFGCNILRSLGVPIAVEYNIEYTIFGGQHFFCSVYDVRDSTWKKFTPGQTILGSHNWSNKSALNYYQQLYGAQYNTPYFLRSIGEYIPLNLSHPCIKDVTSDQKKVCSIAIPFNDRTPNNLAYLAVFSKECEGLSPVTWGGIDKSNNSVTFTNALPNVIYFPVYYPSENCRPFGEPFYFVVDSTETVCIKEVPFVDRCKDSLISMIINRKFLYKPTMRNAARKMVGGRFEGANISDFSDATLLYEITSAPEPKFTNYELENQGEYKYLRYIAPDGQSETNISMLEWITLKTFNYEDCLPVSRIHFTNPDTLTIAAWEDLSNNLVKFGDSTQLSRKLMKLAYDNDMQSTPKGRIISYTHSEPRVVTHVSFAPLNADNGVVSGDNYTLYYWDNEWIEIDAKTAEYEYLVFNNVPANKLYWLKNNMRGREEGLFVVNEDKQLFLYGDLQLNN